MQAQLTASCPAQQRSGTTQLALGKLLEVLPLAHVMRGGVMRFAGFSSREAVTGLVSQSASLNGLTFEECTHRCSRINSRALSSVVLACSTVTFKRCRRCSNSKWLFRWDHQSGGAWGSTVPVWSAVTRWIRRAQGFIQTAVISSLPWCSAQCSTWTLWLSCMTPLTRCTSQPVMVECGKGFRCCWIWLVTFSYGLHCRLRIPFRAVSKLAHLDQEVTVMSSTGRPRRCEVERGRHCKNTTLCANPRRHPRNEHREFLPSSLIRFVAARLLFLEPRRCGLSHDALFQSVKSGGNTTHTSCGPPLPLSTSHHPNKHTHTQKPKQTGHTHAHLWSSEFPSLRLARTPFLGRPQCIGRSVGKVLDKTLLTCRCGAPVSAPVMDETHG